MCWGEGCSKTLVLYVWPSEAPFDYVVETTDKRDVKGSEMSLIATTRHVHGWVVASGGETNM